MIIYTYMEFSEFLEKAREQEQRGGAKHNDAFYEKVKDRAKCLAAREKAISKKNGTGPQKGKPKEQQIKDADNFELPDFEPLAAGDGGEEGEGPQQYAAPEWRDAVSVDYSEEDKPKEDKQKEELTIMQRGLQAIGLGTDRQNEAALESRRRRLRFLLARQGPSSQYKETLKALKGFHVEKMDEDQITLAEEAIALSGYSSWCSGAAEKTALMMGQGAVYAGRAYGHPPKDPQAVVDSVTSDQMLKDDLGSVYASTVVSIPLPLRIIMNFAADVAVGYARGESWAIREEVIEGTPL